MLSLLAHIFPFKMSLHLIYCNLLLNCLAGFGESILVAFRLLIHIYVEVALSALLNCFCGAFKGFTLLDGLFN